MDSNNPYRNHMGRLATTTSSVDHSQDIAPFGAEATNVEQRSSRHVERRTSATTTADHSADIAPFGKDRRASANITVDHSADIAPFGKDRRASVNVTEDHSADIAPFGAGGVNPPSVGYRRVELSSNINSAPSSIDHSNQWLKGNRLSRSQFDDYTTHTMSIPSTQDHTSNSNSTFFYTETPKRQPSIRVMEPVTEAVSPSGTIGDSTSESAGEGHRAHKSHHAKGHGKKHHKSHETTSQHSTGQNTTGQHTTSHTTTRHTTASQTTGSQLGLGHSTQLHTQSTSSSSGNTPDGFFSSHTQDGGRSTFVADHEIGTRHTPAVPSYQAMAKQLASSSSLKNLTVSSKHSSARLSQQSVESAPSEFDGDNDTVNVSYQTKIHKGTISSFQDDDIESHHTPTFPSYQTMAKQLSSLSSLSSSKSITKQSSSHSIQHVISSSSSNDMLNVGHQSHPLKGRSTTSMADDIETHHTSVRPGYQIITGEMPTLSFSKSVSDATKSSTRVTRQIVRSASSELGEQTEEITQKPHIGRSATFMADEIETHHSSATSPGYKVITGQNSSFTSSKSSISDTSNQGSVRVTRQVTQSSSSDVGEAAKVTHSIHTARSGSFMTEENGSQHVSAYPSYQSMAKQLSSTLSSSKSVVDSTQGSTQVIRRRTQSASSDLEDAVNAVNATHQSRPHNERSATFTAEEIETRHASTHPSYQTMVKQISSSSISASKSGPNVTQGGTQVVRRRTQSASSELEDVVDSSHQTRNHNGRSATYMADEAETHRSSTTSPGYKVITGQNSTFTSFKPTVSDAADQESVRIIQQRTQSTSSDINKAANVVRSTNTTRSGISTTEESGSHQASASSGYQSTARQLSSTVSSSKSVAGSTQGATQVVRRRTQSASSDLEDAVNATHQTRSQNERSATMMDVAKQTSSSSISASKSVVDTTQGATQVIRRRTQSASSELEDAANPSHQTRNHSGRSATFMAEEIETRHAPASPSYQAVSRQMTTTSSSKSTSNIAKEGSVQIGQEVVRSASPEQVDTANVTSQWRDHGKRSSTFMEEDIGTHHVSTIPSYHTMAKQLSSLSTSKSASDVAKQQNSARLSIQSAPSEIDEVTDMALRAHSHKGRSATVMVGADETSQGAQYSSEQKAERRLSAPSELDHMEDVAFFYNGKDQHSSTRQEGGVSQSSPPSLDHGYDITPYDEVGSMDYRPGSHKPVRAAEDTLDVGGKDYRPTTHDTPEPKSNRVSMIPALDSVREANSLEIQPDARKNDECKPPRLSIGSIQTIPSSLGDDADVELIYAHGDKRSRSIDGVTQPKILRRLSEESVHSAPSELDHAEVKLAQGARRLHRAHSAEDIEGESKPAENCANEPGHIRGYSLGSLQDVPLASNPSNPTTAPDYFSERRYSAPNAPEPVRRQSRESVRSAPSELDHVAAAMAAARLGGPSPHVAFVDDNSGRSHPIGNDAYGNAYPRPVSLKSKTKTSSKSKFIIYLIILVVYAGGAVIAAGHHFFLLSLNNQDVGDYSQFWVKNASNTFAQIVSILLGLAVTLSISEGVWKVVKSERTSEEVTSDLFTLPAMASVWACMRRRWKFTIVPLVILALVYQLLAFVSMFAPNALSVGPKNTAQDLPVPQLNLSIALTDDRSDGNAAWINLINRLMLISPAENWDVPALCGASCSFEIDYQVPGMTCRDLPQDEITLHPYDPTFLTGDGWTFYEAPYQSLLPLSWGRDDFNLTLNYVPMTAQVNGFAPTSVVETQDLGGNICHFEDQTYRAKFTYSEGDRFVSTELLSSQASELDQQCNWANSGSLSADCQQYSTNVVGLITGFTSPFYGSLTWKSAGIDSNITGPYELEKVINFTNDTASDTVSLHTQASDMNQALQDLFANVTLGALLYLNHTEVRSVTIFEGNAWVYDMRILWALYAPALVLIFFGACYGVYCSIGDEDAKNRNFSTIMLALGTAQSTITRNGEDAWNKSSASTRNHQFGSSNSRGSMMTSSSATLPRSGNVQQPDSMSANNGSNSVKGYDVDSIHENGTNFLNNSSNPPRSPQPNQPNAHGTGTNTSANAGTNVTSNGNSNSNSNGFPGMLNLANLNRLQFGTSSTNTPAGNGPNSPQSNISSPFTDRTAAASRDFLGSLNSPFGQQPSTATTSNTANRDTTKASMTSLGGSNTTTMPISGTRGVNVDGTRGDQATSSPSTNNGGFLSSFGSLLGQKMNQGTSAEYKSLDAMSPGGSNTPNMSNSGGADGTRREQTASSPSHDAASNSGGLLGSFGSLLGQKTNQGTSAGYASLDASKESPSRSDQVDSPYNSVTGMQESSSDARRLDQADGTSEHEADSANRGFLSSLGTFFTQRSRVPTSNSTDLETAGSGNARSIPASSSTSGNGTNGAQGSSTAGIQENSTRPDQAQAHPGQELSIGNYAIYASFDFDAIHAMQESENNDVQGNGANGAQGYAHTGTPGDSANGTHVEQSQNLSSHPGGAFNFNVSEFGHNIIGNSSLSTQQFDSAATPTRTTGSATSANGSRDNDARDLSGQGGATSGQTNSTANGGAARGEAKSSTSLDALSFTHTIPADTVNNRGNSTNASSSRGPVDAAHGTSSTDNHDDPFGTKFWASLGFTHAEQPKTVQSRDTAAPTNFSQDSIVVHTRQSDGGYPRPAFNFSDSSFTTHTNQSNTVYGQSNDALIDSNGRGGRSSGPNEDARGGRNNRDGTARREQNNRKNGKLTMKQRIMTLSTEITMIILLIVAIILAVGHHAFLSRIHGHSTGSTENQFWIRNAGNAFAHIIVICLGTAGGIALTQAGWRAIKLMGLRIKMVDNMFSLPSPKAIKALLGSIRAKHALYLILIVLITQGLIVVSILAPNALTIGFTHPGPIEVAVPSLDLAMPLYDGLITKWDDIIDQMIVNVPSNIWNVPSGCGSNCSFEVVYEAPALSCRDLNPDEFTLTLFDPSNVVTEPNTTTTGIQWTVYDTHSSLSRDETQWNGQNDTSFICNYKPMVLTERSVTDITVTYPTSHAGSSCHCQDGTYRTKFNYIDNQKSVETTLLSYDNTFTGNCTWSDEANLSPKCKNYATNSLQICKAFRNSFSGTVEWYINKTRSTVERPAVLNKIIELNATADGSGVVSLAPQFTNLSQGLVEMFSNMTSNLVPGFDNSTTVDVRAVDGVGVWVYNAAILWSIYGSAIFLIIVIIIYGFYCIHKNGQALDRKVSTLIMVCQDEGLLGDYDDSTSGDQRSEKDGNDTTEKEGYYELSDLHLSDRIHA